MARWSALLATTCYVVRAFSSGPSRVDLSVLRALRMPEETDVVEDVFEEQRGWPKRSDGEAWRAARAVQLGALGAGDMELTFLGTASCIPSTTRGVSCVALRHSGSTWLFDAGEGSQIQVQRSGSVHPGRVDAIFVTHTHGDHSFGLPGLLCIIGQNRDKGSAPLEIYGPEGTRILLRASLRLSHSRVAAPYRVHELRDVPLWRPRGPKMSRRGPPPEEIIGGRLSRPDPAFGELSDGLDIYPDADGCWTLPTSSTNPMLSCRAAPMVHTVPCVGYVIIEADKPGRLDVEVVAPIVARNADALRARGVKQPKKIYQLLKEMKPTQCFTFPDGTELRAADCVAPARRGRVVVMCGDTADASALLPLLPRAADGSPIADCVVHEATNTHMSPWDDKLTPDAVRRATAAHGHSTPQMAAEFALRAHARRLVLTHFSPRYKGDGSPLSLAVMARIESHARRVLMPDDSENSEEDIDLEGKSWDNPPQPSASQNRVVAAWDLLTLPVPPPMGDEDTDTEPQSS